MSYECYFGNWLTANELHDFELSFLLPLMESRAHTYAHTYTRAWNKNLKKPNRKALTIKQLGINIC